jgi:hypothetical protein
MQSHKHLNIAYPIKVNLRQHKGWSNLDTWCPIIRIFSCLSNSIITGSKRTTTSRYDSPPAKYAYQKLHDLKWAHTSITIVELILISVCIIFGISRLYIEWVCNKVWWKFPWPQFPHKSFHHRPQHLVHPKLSKSAWCKEALELFQWFSAEWMSKPSLIRVRNQLHACGFHSPSMMHCQ